MTQDGDAPVEWLVRPLRRSDHEAWVELFRGYATFYGRILTGEQLAEVWRWIFDEGTTIALVVVEGAAPDQPVGVAHLRSWRRPLLASDNGYLDDLFVSPAARGRGAVDALFAAIRDLAVQRGWAIVRWTTAEDNLRAQAVYNRYATRTAWVTYDETIATV